MQFVCHFNLNKQVNIMARKLHILEMNILEI